MADDRKEFKDAYRKRSQLRADKKFSSSPELGKTAIVVSSFINVHSSITDALSQNDAYEDEAKNLAIQLELRGERPVIIPAIFGLVATVLRDPEVASIYTIGNGALSNIALDNGRLFDWSLVSEYATHLKRGLFVQRQCGGLPRDLNVPLGFFALEDHRHLHAAPGAEFSNRLTEDDEARIVQIFDKPDASWMDVKALKSSTAQTEEVNYES